MKSANSNFFTKKQEEEIVKFNFEIEKLISKSKLPTMLIIDLMNHVVFKYEFLIQMETEERLENLDTKGIQKILEWGKKFMSKKDKKKLEKFIKIERDDGGMYG